MSESPNEKNSEMDINPLRDGDTFASRSAPWVGAENAWRQGIVPPPHEDWVHYRTTINPEDLLPMKLSEDLALTDQETATVLSSLPPPIPKVGVASSSAIGLQLLKYAATAAFTAVLVWMIFGRLNHPSDNRSAATPTSAASGLPVFSVQETPATPKPAPIVESTFSPAESSRSVNTGFRPEAHQPLVTRSNTSTKNPAPAAAIVKSVSPDESAGIEAAQDQEVAFNLSNPYLNPTQKDEQEPKALIALPQAPSREAVKAALSAVAPEVSKCASGQKGRLIVEVKVAGADGSVTDVSTISPEFAAGPEGLCAAQAIKLAEFPKFQDESLTIKYPFDL